MIPSATKRRKFDHMTTDVGTRALTRFREPALELVVELDRMRDQYLGEQCRKRQKSRHGRDA